MRINSILIKPLVTEKTLEDAKAQNRYAFLVDRSCTKHEIKEAVEELFGVRVVDVKTAIFRTKPKRATPRRLIKVKKPDLKKAFVRLAEKDKIELFETEKEK